MEVSPQNEMDNPQDFKMFTVERHGLPEHFVSFVLCVERNRCHSYLRLSCDYLGYATVAGTGRDSVFQVCVFLSWVLKLDDQTLVHFISQPTWTLPCAHRPKRLSVRRRRSKTAAESVCGLDVNQSLPQPTKCIPLTPHKVPELTKLQEASYAGIR